MAMPLDDTKTIPIAVRVKGDAISADGPSRHLLRRGVLTRSFRLRSALIAFHEALIEEPRNACRLDRVTFRPNCNLMGVQVMQAQFVEQGFFNDLMREQKRIDMYGLC